MVCVRGGKKRVTGEATRTIKCNCPFKVTGQKLINGLWKASLTYAVDNQSSNKRFYCSRKTVDRDTKNRGDYKFVVLVTSIAIVLFLKIVVVFTVLV